tara:strand:- start:1199 stop:1330 length:132 start_codon:yes stop_codon:yes gene_type:complete
MENAIEQLKKLIRQADRTKNYDYLYFGIKDIIDQLQGYDWDGE